MRILALASVSFVALWAACTSNENYPPNLPDFDGAPPVSPGGGGGGDGGFDSGDGGAITALAGASNPKGIFLAAGYVYYTNFASGGSDGSIATVATTGGQAATLASTLTAPWALVVTSGFAFFTQAPVAGTGGVSAVATTGGTVTPVRQSITDAFGIVTDGTNLFWTTGNSGAGVSVETIPISGGSTKDILDIGGDISPTAMTLLGTSLFISTTGTQAAPLAGQTTGTGNLTELDTPTSIAMSDIAVSSTTIYVAIDDAAPNGAIVAYPRGSGSPQTIVTSLNHPRRLALDGTHLYFTDELGGNVWVVDLTTNTSGIYASSLNAPLPIAVADALYVGDADAIVRIPKL